MKNKWKKYAIASQGSPSRQNSTLHRDACKDVGNELVTKKGFM